MNRMQAGTVSVFVGVSLAGAAGFYFGDNLPGYDLLSGRFALQTAMWSGVLFIIYRGDKRWI